MVGNRISEVVNGKRLIYNECARSPHGQIERTIKTKIKKYKHTTSLLSGYYCELELNFVYVNECILLKVTELCKAVTLNEILVDKKAIFVAYIR